MIYCETLQETCVFSPCPPFAWWEDATPPEAMIDLFAAEAPPRVQRGCRECDGPARCAPWSPRIAASDIYCWGGGRCDDYSEAPITTCKHLAHMDIFRMPLWCRASWDDQCLWSSHRLCTLGKRARDLLVFCDNELAAFCTLEAFLEANETLSPEEVSVLRGLALGETYGGGGGASPGWNVLRVA